MSKELTVCKFGGTSLATAARFENVIDILQGDPFRRVVVVSAPGDYDGVKKMTSLLIDASKVVSHGGTPNLKSIKTRIYQVCKGIEGLGDELISNLEKELSSPTVPYFNDLIASFGERKISSKVLEARMRKRNLPVKIFDPKQLNFQLIINEQGDRVPDMRYAYEINAPLEEHLSNPSSGFVIIPGFYGYMEGHLRTLPRGGSDITGAVIANLIGAECYENWTDQNGLSRADPKLVPNAQTIPELTFLEARELTPFGFKLHPDSLPYVSEKNIPVLVKNSFHPDVSGTRIQRFRVSSGNETIVGVAAKKGYSQYGIYLLGMNDRKGFGRYVFEAFEREGVAYEHSPTGNDFMSIWFPDSKNSLPNEKRLLIERELKRRFGPFESIWNDDLAVVAVVGQNYNRDPMNSARIETALAKGSISTYMTSQCNKISRFYGVHANDADNAVRAIHNEFFK